MPIGEARDGRAAVSIASMVDTKLVRERPVEEPPAPVSQPGAPAQPAPVGVPTNIVNQLTRYVPTETITLYIAFLAAIGSLTIPSGSEVCQISFTSRWIGLAIFAVVSSLLALGLTYGKARQSKQAFTWPIFEMIVAPIAFSAWALALPDTPLLDICGYSTVWGGFIVLVTTVTIAVVAWILGKAVDYVKIITE
jgi:hypothetical protein